jgi:hypothetical protein
MKKLLEMERYVLMRPLSNKEQILGFRVTKEFSEKFEGLCDRLGHTKSDVARYCLKKFFNEHFNNPEAFRKARSEMF